MATPDTPPPDTPQGSDVDDAGHSEPSGEPIAEQAERDSAGSTPPADETSTPPPPSDPPPPAGQTSTPPPPSDPPPPAGGGFYLSLGGKRLYRRSENRVLAGVASGLGDFFGLDPAIFRVIFVALALFGGSGFLLYLLGWLFLPVRGRESIGEGLLRKVGGVRSAGGIALIVVATLVVLDSLQGFGGGPLLAALLIGAGVLLYRSDGDRGNGASPEDGTDHNANAGAGGTRIDPPPTGPGATGGTGVPAGDRPAAGTDVVAERSTMGTEIPAEVYDELPPPPPGLYDDWRPTPQPPPPEPPPPPSILGRLTFAAALILVGAVALLENVTPLDVSAASYAAMVLVVLGAGLIVGARWGRARGLIALGLVAIILLTTSSALPSVPANGIGQRRYTPQVVGDIRRPYELTVGEMIIDLTELQLAPSQRATVDANVGIGSLKLIVPDDVGLEGDATTNLGQVDALDRTSSGSDSSVTLAESGTEGSPTVSLDLRAGVGEITIDRAPAEVGR